MRSEFEALPGLPGGHLLFHERIATSSTPSNPLAATFFAGPGGSPNTSLPAFSVAHAGENAWRTAGFADLVEKVKPAVISVRGKAFREA